MRWAYRQLWTVATIVAVAGLTGCGGTDMRITDAGAALPEGEDSAAFLDRVSALPHVSENDVMRGLIMAMDGEDVTETFEQRVGILAEKDVVGPRWQLAANRPVTRGRLAYMVYQACRMPGGVILTVAGPSERYCLRELQYRRMMARGSQFAPVTGLEFVGVLSRADTYIRTGQSPNAVAEAPMVEDE